MHVKVCVDPNAECGTLCGAKHGAVRLCGVFAWEALVRSPYIKDPIWGCEGTCGEELK